MLRTFLYLLALALLVRIAGVTWRGEWTADPHEKIPEMSVQARLLVEGRGFGSVYDQGASPSTLLPPAYPVYLAAWMRLQQALGYPLLPWHPAIYATLVSINLLASALTAALAWRIAVTLNWPARAAVGAGIIMAFWPEAIRASGFVWDQAFFALAAAGILLALLQALRQTPRWRHTVLLGAASGLLTLLNPAFFPSTVAAWTLGIFLRLPSPLAWRLRRTAAHAGLFVLLAFAAGSPWHIRNWLLIDPPAYVFVRGGLWMEIWAAQHPIKFVYENGRKVAYPRGPWWGTEKLERDGQTLTEAQYIDWCRQRAQAQIAARPSDYFRHVAKQVTGFWLCTTEAIRWEKPWYKFFVPLGVPALLGLVGLALARRATAPYHWWPLVALLLIFPLPYYLTNASMRFRHPIDILFALGIGWLIHTLLSRLAKTEPRA